MIKAIIFDFDGVLVESVDIKTEAFRELFKSYPAHLQEFIRYHLLNGGVSRFEKIRYFYKKFLNTKISEDELKKLCEQYSQLVVEKVLRAPYVPGAEALLKACWRSYTMFVVSGTPQEEMCAIVQERGLADFFKEVYGSPSTKSRLVKKILKTHVLHPEETIFIGDSLTDLSAAKESRIRFIARTSSEKMDWLNDETVIATFPDLHTALPFIQSLNEEYEKTRTPL